MFEIIELSKEIESFKKKVKEAYSNIGRELVLNEDTNSSISIAFIGQYSAGKSTIIKALTNIDEIEIGAGITTECATKYLWNGIYVVDTPGICSELRPDHDEKSYAAINSSDMLVFVISNELFDDYLANHFRDLAIDKDKAGEMLIVVNKMERTALGNVKEQQEIICNDIEKVIQPYTTEQMRLSFIDAKTYLDYLNEKDYDLEYAEELLEASGFEKFEESLNDFIKNRGIASKLTTPLYEIESQLENVILDLTPSSNDNDVDALEENYLQQRHELFDSQVRLKQELNDIFTGGVLELRDIGISSSNLITEDCEQNAVEEQLVESIDKANLIIDNCCNDANKVYEKRMQEIGQAIEKIESSAFTQKLVCRLEDKFDNLPNNLQNMLIESGYLAKNAGNIILQNAYNSSAAGGLKLTNFSGSNIHNAVITIGHKVGYKFKPWQAVKIAKGTAIAGQALGIFGIGLDTFLQIKEDHDANKRGEIIRNNRQNIRGQFNSVASELENYGRDFIDENVSNIFENSIQYLDNNINEIRSMRASKDSEYNRFVKLQKECQNLIERIHDAEINPVTEN